MTFGSGCLHADRLVAGCVLFENGKPQMGPGGRPEFRAVWLPKDKVQIHDTWHTTGLARSGSNDYSVQDVVVPRTHSFHPFRAGARLEPLYRYQGFFVALPSVALGCARRVIDDFREFAEREIAPPALTPLKNEYRAQVALAEATTRLGAARAYQNSSLSSIWHTVASGETPTAAQRAAVGMMAIHGLQETLKVGEIVCEAGAPSQHPIVVGQEHGRTIPFRCPEFKRTAHGFSSPRGLIVKFLHRWIVQRRRQDPKTSVNRL